MPHNSEVLKLLREQEADIARPGVQGMSELQENRKYNNSKHLDPFTDLLSTKVVNDRLKSLRNIVVKPSLILFLLELTLLMTNLLCPTVRL